MSATMTDPCVVNVAIQAEIVELVCEIVDIEPFEITPSTPLERYRHGVWQPRVAIAATLECAFGVRFERHQVAAMVDLDRVCAALESALRRKWQSRDGVTPR